MLNESLENLEKELKDSKTIKEYLITKIKYYDYIMYSLKQKIENSPKIEQKDNIYFMEQFNYYDACRKTATQILSELKELQLRNF